MGASDSNVWLQTSLIAGKLSEKSYANQQPNYFRKDDKYVYADSI